MANTNLYQSGDQPTPFQKKSVSLDKGMIFSGLLLLLILAVYGSVSWYKSSLVTKKAEIEANIKKESQMLLSSDASLAADFQNRLDKIKENLDAKQNPTEFLDKIEDTILPEAVIKKFSYDSEEKMLELEINVDNFRTMAKQIFIFKQEELAENVIVSEVIREEDSSVSFIYSGTVGKDESVESIDGSESSNQ